jgi:hypothetical protein
VLEDVVKTAQVGVEAVRTRLRDYKLVGADITYYEVAVR